jgi:hypothetical protein
MADWISQKLGPIPKPRRDATFDLQDIIGAPGVRDIEKLGSIRFHATGDTGRPTPSTPQEDVAKEMGKDFSPSAAGDNPAFFLHLGDIIYGHDKELLYRDEFYRPYKDYPGKILAIAGNHDGEIFRGSDPTALRAFLANFCANTAVIPPIANEVRILRATMTLPGVYWLLNAPFLQLIGLYSNIAEGPGHLEGANGDQTQIKWLENTLAKVAQARRTGKRRALLIAVHHPPFSNGGHSGSPEMLQTIDAACQKAGVAPDAILSGHAHNYQRHTRRITLNRQTLETPYLVAGCGGHNDSSVDPANGQRIGDHTFDSSMKGFGYLNVKASASQLSIEMREVPRTGSKPFDAVTVRLT